MTMTASQKFITTIIVLALVCAGAYFAFIKKASAPASSTTSTSTSQTATSTAGAQVPVNATLVTPDYKKPIAFSADTSADIRAQLNTELAAAQAQIAANPLNMDAWTNLGTIHKQGGDYANAALYWEFVTSSYSGPATPYYSLGDLYENFIHDYAKAETNYLAAISVDPHNVNAYASLYTMYHFTLKDDTKAAAILAQGLKANPGNNYLLGLQAQLQGTAQ